MRRDESRRGRHECPRHPEVMKRASNPDSMPAALPSMWRALVRAREAEPLLLGVSFALALLSALPDALLALWLSLLADGILAAKHRQVMAASIGLGASAAATWFLRVISDR